MIGGPYALLAVGAVVVGLGGYGAYQYQRAEAAAVRAEAAEGRASRLTQALSESEADKEALRVAAEVLDRQLVERDRRAKELDDAKRNLKNELDAIKSKLPQQDIDCLNRDMPDAIRERLRGR